MTAAQPADPSRYSKAPRWRRPPEIAAGTSPVCFVVYRNPRDFNGYVMRAFGVDDAGLTPLDYVIGGTLDSCRAMVPAEARQRRFHAPDDADCIFEIWF